MRYFARSAVALSLFIGVLAIVDCGDDESPPGANSSDTATADGTYSGAMIGEAFVATIKLTVPSSGTGTAALRPLALGPVTVSGTIESTTFGGTVTVTGTYDPATQTLTFRAISPKGEISFRGTYAHGTFSGPPAQTPFGPVPVLLLKDILGIKVYCGQVAAPTPGLIGVYTAREQAGAAYSLASGAKDAIRGTFAGTAINVEGNGAKVTGTLSGATLTGSLNTTGGVGSFTATEGQCSALAAAIVDGGSNDDSGSDNDAGNMPDSGPPKTPELVKTTNADAGIGHITLANGTLYYTIAHPYFSQKLEVHKVGTNGQDAAALVPVNTPTGDAGVSRTVAAGLAVVGSTLYVSAGTDSPGGPAVLYSVPTGGGTLTSYGEIGAASFMENYNTFVADSNGLYRAQCLVSANVKGFSLAGGTGGTVDNLILPCGIATDGTNVFFGGGETTGIQRVSHAIATSQQTPTQVAAADDYKLNGFFSSMQAMTLDATHVYWAAADNAGKKGGLWRRAKDGSGTTQTIAALPKLHRGQIAVDDTYLYFFMTESSGQGPGSSNIYRIAKTATNGAPELIGSANPFSVVSDGAYVYYGEGKNLRRVAK